MSLKYEIPKPLANLAFACCLVHLLPPSAPAQDDRTKLVKKMQHVAVQPGLLLWPIQKEQKQSRNALPHSDIVKHMLHYEVNSPNRAPGIFYNV